MLPGWIDALRQASLGSSDAVEEVGRLDHAAQSESVAYLRSIMNKREALLAAAAGRSRTTLGVTSWLFDWLAPVVFKDRGTEAQYQQWRAHSSTAFQKSVHILLLFLLAALWATIATDGHTVASPTMIASCVGEGVLWAVAALLIWRQPFRPDLNTELVACCDTLAGVLVFFSTIVCTEWCYQLGCSTMKATGLYNVSQYLTGFVFLLIHGISLCLQVRTMLAHMLVLYCVWFGLFIPQFAITLASRVFGPLSHVLLCAVVCAQTYQYHVTSRLQFHMVVELSMQIRANKDHLEEVEAAHSVALKERVLAERARTTRDIHDGIMGYMCHQLRNPLHALRGILEQLRSQCTPDHVVTSTDIEFLDIAQASTTQLAKVSDDVLEFQRVQSGFGLAARVYSCGFMRQLQNGSSVRKYEAASVRTIISRSVQDFPSNVQSTISVSISPEVPLGLHTDSSRVAQMLTIGLSNALKYRKVGTSVTLSCFRRATPHEVDAVWFEILNEGEGLGTVDVATLFDPYAASKTGDVLTTPRSPQAAATANATRSNRLGLGLPISRLTSVLLGGQVGLEDRGKFTAYWFWIPSPESSDVEVHVPSSSPTPLATPLTHNLSFSQSMPIISEIASEVTQEHPWSYWGQHHASVTELPMTVMVVDDLQTNRRLLQAMLRKQGHCTVELEDGDLILGSLQDGSAPAILLLDIHMVRTDGRDVVKLLREQGYTFPIIAVTGNVSLSDIRSYHQTGFDGVMGKPFTSAHLHDLLEAAKGRT